MTAIEDADGCGDIPVVAGGGMERASLLPEINSSLRNRMGSGADRCRAMQTVCSTSLIPMPYNGSTLNLILVKKK